MPQGTVATAAIVAVGLALTVPGVAGGGSKEGAKNGRIVYVGDDVGRIFTIQRDGSGKASVRDKPRFIYDPGWSSDGRTIVTSSVGRSSQAHIVVYNRNGKKVEDLGSQGRYAFDPDLSPNGKKIAYIKGTAKRNVLVVQRVVSDSARTLYKHKKRSCEGPSYSPDGEWLAFTCVKPQVNFNTGWSAIWVIRPDGSGLRRVTSRELHAGHPNWSPDGSKIVFSDKRLEPGGNIWTVDFDGDNPTRLTHFAPKKDIDLREPTYSPDGRFIALTRTKGFQKKGPNAVSYIAVMHADGTHLRVLKKRPGFSPDWGPKPRLAR